MRVEREGTAMRHRLQDRIAETFPGRGHHHEVARRVRVVHVESLGQSAPHVDVGRRDQLLERRFVAVLGRSEQPEDRVQCFDSKTDLYREIVAQLAETLLTSLKAAVSAAETPRAKIEVAFRVYFEMVVSETDAFRILFIHSHEGDTAKELRVLELGLISFMFPFFDASMSEDHRRQLAGGVVGIAE